MAVSVVIIATDVTGYLKYGFGARPISGSRAVDQITSVQIQFLCRDGGMDSVARGQVLSIYNNGVRRFAGDIDTVRKTQLRGDPNLPEGVGYSLDITAVSALSRFDHLRIPARVYENMTCGEIATDLIATVGALEGIGLGAVEDGPTIERVVYDQTPMLDALRELATQAGFIFDVDDEFLFQFHARTTVAAPVDLTDDLIRTDTTQWYTSRADFRTRQKIRINPAAFRVRRELIGPGDDIETEFDVSRGIGQLLAVAETTATRGTVTGTFTGNPSNGQTVTIRDFVYTFKNTLDNRQAFEVKIGANAQATAENLVAAINDSGDGRGTKYSWGTWAHYNAIAGTPTGGAFTLYAQLPGDDGNEFVTVSEAATNFAWSDSSALGGEGTNGEPLQFGLTDDTEALWTYDRGGATLTRSSPLPLDTYLLVSYFPFGADTITIENSTLVAARAAIEDTSGIYENMVERTDMEDPILALELAQALLAAYSNPQEMQIGTDRDGFVPGQLLTIDSAQEFADYLNGDWLITQTDFWLDATATDLDGTVGDNFLRTHIRGIDATRSGNTWRFWEKLATVGSGGGGSSTITPRGATLVSSVPLRFVFGIGPSGQSASVVIDSTTEVVEFQQPVTYKRWTLFADNAPTGADAEIDVLKNGGASVFATVPALPDGDTRANGTCDVVLSPADYVRGKAIAVGTTTAAKRLVLTLYP